MPRDPRNRVTDEGAQPLQPEIPSGLVPEEIAEPVQKQATVDPDWLSMTTADPAFFLHDTGPE
jgi:hypothetical protein